MAESTGFAVFPGPGRAWRRASPLVGDRHDPETGLIYLNARYMDPVFGRFISPDDWDPTMEGAGRIGMPKRRTIR